MFISSSGSPWLQKQTTYLVDLSVSRFRLIFRELWEILIQSQGL